jgi:hypothetical protein
VAHLDRPPFSGLASLTGHCGHGWTGSLTRPVAIDPQADMERWFNDVYLGSPTALLVC